MSNKKGGQGSKATTKQSRATDKVVKETCEQLAKELNITWKPYMRIPFITPGSRSGNQKKLTPDGGIFYNDKGEMVLCVEAKHQGKIGNAIERWYKNNMLIRAYGNQSISYVTLISGYVKDDGGMIDTLKPIHSGILGSIDSFTVNKNSLFRSEQWTSDEVKQTIKSCLEQVGLVK